MIHSVYLDNAATTAIDPLVAEVVYQSMLQDYGNPSSIHTPGRKSRGKVEQARKSIAKIFNASPSEIIFTAGGTEADNLAIRGAVNGLGVKHIISSKIEHSAVLTTILNISESSDVEVHWVKHLPNGMIDLMYLDQLLVLCADSPTLVSLMHINNEVGNEINLDVIGKMCRNYKNTYFHSDTVQSIGHQILDLKSLPVDFITCSAHKIHGPKGVGFLYAKGNLPIKSIVTGGNQERNNRAGTENIAGIVGMQKALELAYTDIETKEESIKSIKAYAISQLREKLPKIVFNTNLEHSCNSILSVQLPSEKDASILLFNLDLAGVYVSGGSACTSGSNKGSHVLTELGVSPNNPSIRVSFSRLSKISDVDQLIESLLKSI